MCVNILLKVRYQIKYLKRYRNVQSVQIITLLTHRSTGNIWGQSWSNLLDVTLPYPGKTYPDATHDMRAQVGFQYFLYNRFSTLCVSLYAI